MTASIVTTNPKDSFEELTNEQKEAIELMAKGYTLKFISDALQKTTATLRNWKHQRHFKIALAEAINLKTEASNYKLHDLWRRSLETCEE